MDRSLCYLLGYFGTALSREAVGTVPCSYDLFTSSCTLHHGSPRLSSKSKSEQPRALSPVPGLQVHTGQRGLLTNDGFLQAGLHRQDILLHQLHGARPLCNLLVEVIGQPGSLQLQLFGLEGRLSRGLCHERTECRRMREGPVSALGTSEHLPFPLGKEQRP